MKRSMLHTLAVRWALAALGAFACMPASAQIAIDEINPIRSSLHATNANGGSGGRIQSVAADPQDGNVYYAASEWGGLYKTVDRGRTWDRLDNFLATAAWRVAVQPGNSQVLVATALFDGRTDSRAGILRSGDGGLSWMRPVSATPPAGACADNRAVQELSGFGVAFDPAHPERVYAATNCGLAVSTDGGQNWRYLNPMGAGGARRLVDVIVHGGGIDVCGDIGHRRSTDGGTTWSGPTAAGNPLPGGVCSLAVSPHESGVLFATSGTAIFESDDGGGNWGGSYVNPARQGRIPFVMTNRTGTDSFDLWFGDVSLFRAACARPANGTGNRCPASGSWVNVSTGAHADAGRVAFDPRPPETRVVSPACNARCQADRRECAAEGLTRPATCTSRLRACLARCPATMVATSACPVLFSNDGGVYRNTRATHPACQTPAWDQPERTPRSLWLWNLSGAALSGAGQEEAYMLAQDNGAIGTRTAASTPPTWNHSECCDGFGSGAQPNQVVYSLGVYSPPPAVRLFRRGGGMSGGLLLPVASQPPGGIVSFNFGKSIAWVEGNVYVVLTGTGLQRTADITAGTVAWTRLGTLPAAGCSVSVSRSGGQLSFFVQSGNCDGSGSDRVFRYDGQVTGGAWAELTPPVIAAGQASRFALFAVDPNNRQSSIAAVVAGPDLQMMRSANGGTTWTRIPGLETRLTANGAFLMRSALGPTGFSPNLSGYAQPTLLAFSPLDGRTIVVGGYDSGLQLSLDRGATWTTLTDNSGGAANPVIPRPRTAHFEADGANGRLYIGTQGRGAWRVAYPLPSPPEAPTPCADDCSADRDSCLADAGTPGQPTAAQCAQSFARCVRACGTRGCRTGQKCCEPGGESCRICVPRAAQCP